MFDAKLQRPSQTCPKTKRERMSRRSNAHKQRVDQTYSYMRKMTSEKDFKANNSTNGTMCKWDPPDEEERQLALGQEVTSPPSLISACHNIPCHPRFCQDCQPRAFGCCPHSKYIPGYFEPKTVSKSIDWLYDGNPGESERDGQSYQAFLGSHRYKPSQSRKRIYLCDLDDDLSDDPC